jgi:hypothetical protein
VRLHRQHVRRRPGCLAPGQAVRRPTLRLPLPPTLVGPWPQPFRTTRRRIEPTEAGRARSLLNGNNLTGTIPDTLRTAVRLKELALQRNQLSGSIPDAIGWPIEQILHL